MYKKIYDNSTNNNVYDKKYKIILVGSDNVGKTSILHRYFNNDFLIDYNSTIGVDFIAKVIDYNNNKYKLHIWDTGGFTDYQKILNSYFKNGDLFLFVFDLNRINSIYSLEKWIDHVKYLRGGNEMLGILIGNKSDIIDKNINQLIINTLSNKFGLPYIEVSCKNGKNINDIFDIAFTLLENKCTRTDNNSIVIEHNNYFQDTNKYNKCSCNII
jgi:small GTP-binding protein